MSGYMIYDALGLLEGWGVGAVGGLTVLLVDRLSDRLADRWRTWREQHATDPIEPAADTDTGPIGFVPDVPENLADWLADAPSLRLDDLDLTVRSYKALTRHGLRTVDQLIQFTPDGLLRIHNFGPGSLRDVQAKLAAAGWLLADAAACEHDRDPGGTCRWCGDWRDGDMHRPAGGRYHDDHDGVCPPIQVPIPAEVTA